MQRQGALVNNTKLFKAFLLIQTQRIISWECLLWPFPYLEAPFIFRLTTADCYSLKVFQLTLAADPVPQGPLCTPSLGHWHCIDTNTEIFTFLQPYFSTLLKAADRIPFFLQKERMKIWICFTVTCKLQNREPQVILEFLISMHTPYVSVR